METYIDKVCKEVETKSGIKSKFLIRYYALLVLTKGESITASDVHDGWAMNMNFKERNAYCYGHDHLSLVPFDELSEECQHKDDRFVENLKKITADLKKIAEDENEKI